MPITETEARAILKAESKRVSTRIMAERANLQSHTPLARWLNGSDLKGKNRELVLRYAETVRTGSQHDAPPATNQPLAYWDGAAWAAERMSETVTSILREYRIAREAQTALANVTADGKGAVVPGRASAKERKAGDG